MAAIARADPWVVLPAATTAQSIGRIFGLVRANVARVVAGEPVESVVNGLGPIVQRRQVTA